MSTLITILILAFLYFEPSTTVLLQSSNAYSFCHNLDCPKYSVINTYQGYEHRRYEMAQWVATKVITKNYDSTLQSKMFHTLLRYISGNNTAGQKIPMTSPVLTAMSPGVNSNHDTVAEMHFMIPYKMQPFPPTPTETEAYITYSPPVDVYVKAFSGFASTTDYMIKVIELQHEINNSSLYVNNHYYTAGYEGPYQINRHNEVWLVATHSV